MDLTSLLVGLLAGCTPEPPSAPPPSAPPPAPAPVEPEDPQHEEALARFAATLEAQDRVNTYFHHEVAPKLEGCWGALHGEGAATVRVLYRRVGSAWGEGQGTITASSLPPDQKDAALRCLQEAVRGTSFPAEAADGDATDFQVDWTLPVPWPTDLAAVAKSMIDGGGGGGCGGESLPGCQDCLFIPLFGFSLCVPACNGYRDCVLNPDGNGCKMPKGLCVSAPIYGNAGGFRRY